jgi:hypothetical protein
VVVEDAEGHERELCDGCWKRLERTMPLKVQGFAATHGDPTA